MGEDSPIEALIGLPLILGGLGGLIGAIVGEAEGQTRWHPISIPPPATAGTSVSLSPFIRPGRSAGVLVRIAF